MQQEETKTSIQDGQQEISDEERESVINEFSAKLSGALFPAAAAFKGERNTMFSLSFLLVMTIIPIIVVIIVWSLN